MSVVTECCVCHRPLPPRAIADHDPFCSSACCREYHHAPITEIPDWRVGSGYVDPDIKYHRRKVRPKVYRVHLHRRHFLIPSPL